MTPRATYRFQFHRGFTFADAEALVPYLDALGISHVYASPVTTARPGSMHGYDVVDPTRVNPELGGEAGLRSLVAALRARGMGLIVDIVPNHMGVGPDNGWWMDVLENGQASRWATTFDIDWRRPVMLPVLGDGFDAALAKGDIALDRSGDRPMLVAYGEHRFPLRAEDADDIVGGGGADLAALHARQHYRLACWRDADAALNWRRFFTINELAGVRVEDEAVFEAVHALIFRLHDEGLIDGVRVDHVDGLTDPAGYGRRLRARLGAEAWIVVEKILGAGEALAADWGIDGTSGYDFMDAATAILHDPAGERPLADLWAGLSGRSPRFDDEELVARQQMLAAAFAGQRAAVVEAFAELAESAEFDWSIDAIGDAIDRLLWVFPVYRTYGTGRAAPLSDAAIRARVRRRAGDFLDEGQQAIADALLAWLAGEGSGDPVLAADAVRRFEQLSAPIAAKAVEDTGFYRYGRLLSRNDVGSDPDRFAWDIPAFHRAMADRARDWPHAMLTTATHDHKRGEDSRARLAVLSEIPDLWRAQVDGWLHINLPLLDGIDRGDAYMLFQSIVGAVPADLDIGDGVALAAFAERIGAWAVKALREARLRSSWEDPDGDYEARMIALIDALSDPALSSIFLASLRQFVTAIAPAAHANSLVQAGLRCTVPGIPDLYQGAECEDISLVDPDNRRPVDFALRRHLLEGDGARGFDATKIAVIRNLLGLRRDHPALFADGAYVPVAVEGARAGHVLAFLRDDGTHRLLCAFALRLGGALVGTGRAMPDRAWWGDTRLIDGGRSWAVADLFADGPVAVDMVVVDAPSEAPVAG
jgi:(1->4)-alpha-D-glucan 1-alpha-D-glucosylmutase